MKISFQLYKETPRQGIKTRVICAKNGELLKTLYKETPRQGIKTNLIN